MDPNTVNNVYLYQTSNRRVILAGAVGGAVGTTIMVGVFAAAFRVPKKKREWLSEQNASRKSQ